MCPGDLAPDNPDLGAADLLLAPVDESNLLAEVEVGGLGGVNALQLEQAGVGVGVAGRQLVYTVVLSSSKHEVEWVDVGALVDNAGSNAGLSVEDIGGCVMYARYSVYVPLATLV